MLERLEDETAGGRDIKQTGDVDGTLVIIADIRVLRAIDRSACVVGDATVFVR